MIFKFILLSDEVDNFAREIQINPDATFLELNNAILDSVGYTKDQMTSFFICNDYWEKEQEITLMEMDTSSEYDSLVMEEIKIEEFVSDEGQKLMFVFDNLNERAFFMELQEIISGKKLAKAQCTVTKGKAPVQVLDDLFIDPDKKRESAGLEFDDFQFDDDDEFDDEDLSDLNIDDNYFENQNYWFQDVKLKCKYYRTQETPENRRVVFAP